MFKFKESFPSPAERTLGSKNTKTFIVDHHTGTGKGTAKGVIDGLFRRADYASCHFFVDEFGNAYKFGSPDDVLWHAGVSEWNGYRDINQHSLGIEIQGPLGVGKEAFNDSQRKTVRELTQHLMAVFRIPNKNVLRHADLTHALSGKGIHWDGKSKSRKVDVADGFWNAEFKSWKDYQASLVPKESK